jgi:hypothetical protein
MDFCTFQEMDPAVLSRHDFLITWQLAAFLVSAHSVFERLHVDYNLFYGAEEIADL